MSEISNVAIAAGFIVPFIVSFLKSNNWSQEIKHALSLVVALVFAVATTAIDKGVSLDTWQALVSNFGVIFAEAQIFYIQFFQKTELNYKIEESGIK